MAERLDVARFDAALERARAKRTSGDLPGSLDDYETALRMITPDDEGYQRVFAAREAGLPTATESESPNLDRMDSAIRAEMVEVLRELGRFDDAYHHALIAHYLDELVHGPSHNDTAASLLDLGLIELERNHPADAEAWFRASAGADEDVAREDPDLWTVKWRTIERAGARATWGHFGEAVNAILTLLPEIEGELEPHKRVQQLSSGAQYLQNLGEHERGRELLERAIEIQRSAAPGHPQLGRLYSNLAIMRHEQLDFAEAEQYAREASRGGPLIGGRSRAAAFASDVGEDRAQLEAWMSAERTDRPYEVFLSFNTRDETLVQSLHDALEELGLRTWWFKEDPDWSRPKTDDEVRESIFGAIDKAQMVVFVGSGTSLTSEFVLEEVAHSQSVGIPFLIWYPEGVRLQPAEAADRSVTTREHLLGMVERLFRPGVGALYGYGLRKPRIEAIAAAIRDRFCRLSPTHPLARAFDKNDGPAELCPTRLWPTLLDAQGRPLFPELIRR